RAMISCIAWEGVSVFALFGQEERQSYKAAPSGNYSENFTCSLPKPLHTFGFLLSSSIFMSTLTPEAIVALATSLPSLLIEILALWLACLAYLNTRYHQRVNTTLVREISP